MPLVILQIAVGIVVGTSIIGQFWPAFERWLFGGPALQGLSALAFWGVTFFIFYTGLHIEKTMFFGPRATAEFWVLAFTSLFLPFGIGCFIGWLLLDVWFDHSLLGSDGTYATYILSIGVCVGVTALPVLSAILIEIGQLQSDIGILMIGCATVHDVVLWLLITLIFGLAGGPDNWAGAWQPLASFGLLIALVLALRFVYVPLMCQVLKTVWWQQLAAVPRLAITLAVMYLSAICSEILQVHTLVGVVLFGAFVPVSEKPFVMGHIDILNRALFLPLFFGASGLQVKLNHASSRTGWIFLALTVGAIIGQVCGSLFVAKLFRRSWKQACVIATFMLCKGGVGIIVATLLSARHIIGQDTFSAMMLMALACTAVTKPAILLIQSFFPGGTSGLFDLPQALPHLASPPRSRADGPESACRSSPKAKSDDSIELDLEGPSEGEVPTEDDNGQRAPNPYFFLAQQDSVTRVIPQLTVPPPPMQSPSGESLSDRNTRRRVHTSPL
eukprot:EG_transcript_7782